MGTLECAGLALIENGEIEPGESWHQLVKMNGHPRQPEDLALENLSSFGFYAVHAITDTVGFVDQETFDSNLQKYTDTIYPPLEGKRLDVFMSSVKEAVGKVTSGESLMVPVDVQLEAQHAYDQKSN